LPKADDGLFLLHTIGKELSTTTTADPFMTKYLFPGGNMPSIAQIGGAVEKSFVMEDWHLIGPDYDRTLMAWFENFDSGWDRLKVKYDGRFYRLWKHCLLYYSPSSIPYVRFSRIRLTDHDQTSCHFAFSQISFIHHAQD
jgi:cyclopropane fatty-acyl-phospholipid synthase-like methyltransferase